MKALSPARLDFYDISPAVSEETAVFPGDTPFRRDVSLDFKKGNHLGLSAVHTTVHIGAHADAPSHYHPEGRPIDERPLEPYLGPCQVVAVKASRGARVKPSDLGALKITTERVLIKTDSFPDPDRWTNDFNSLSPELIDRLACDGVRLVGIDTPSIDPWDSKGLESHRAAHRHDMSLLEGIVLSQVPAGIYQLVALPLRLKGADASPVRAILIKNQ
ncbi:MAG: cyclase family protein [Elusimicrobia bacterium]|nr:cyclase family protein [Elusimicrobiota bacterium]